MMRLERYRRALNSPDKLSSLTEEIKNLRKEGISKEDLLEDLELFRNQLEEIEEDIVLDVMDFLTGFCCTHLIID